MSASSSSLPVHWELFLIIIHVCNFIYVCVQPPPLTSPSSCSLNCSLFISDWHMKLHTLTFVWLKLPYKRSRTGASDGDLIMLIIKSCAVDLQLFVCTLKRRQWKLKHEMSSCLVSWLECDWMWRLNISTLNIFYCCTKWKLMEKRDVDAETVVSEWMLTNASMRLQSTVVLYCLQRSAQPSRC